MRISFWVRTAFLVLYICFTHGANKCLVHINQRAIVSSSKKISQTSILKLRGGSERAAFEYVSPEEASSIKNDALRMWHVSEQESLLSRQQEGPSIAERIQEISEAEAFAVLDNERKSKGQEVKASDDNQNTEDATAEPFNEAAEPLNEDCPANGTASIDTGSSLAPDAAMDDLREKVPLEALSAPSFLNNDFSPPALRAPREPALIATTTPSKSAVEESVDTVAERLPDGENAEEEGFMSLKELRRELEQVRIFEGLVCGGV
jgi:hypothetical protein